LLQRYFFTGTFGYGAILGHQDVCRLITDPLQPEFNPDQAREPINAWYESRPERAGVVSSEILCGNPFCGGREAYEPDPSRYHYDRLASYDQPLSGASNVLVTPLEELARDPVKTVERTSVFAGADPSPVAAASVPPRMIESTPKRVAPVLLRSKHVRLGPLKPETLVSLDPVATYIYRGISWLGRRAALRRRLSASRPAVKARFSGRFAGSCRRLQAMLNDTIDLRAYGYDL
jgi:hypothetical protein